MKKYIVLLTAALTVAVILAGVYISAKPKINFTPKTEQTQKVNYVDPALKPLVDKYKLYGVDIYMDNYAFPANQNGHYSNINQVIYIKSTSPQIENTLNHEYVHYRQQSSPAIDWKPFYDSYPAVRNRLDEGYGEYIKEETEAVACAEIKNLPSPYLERCNFLLPNRNLLPFILDTPR